MNVLIVGGGGYVGSILRPALEAAHNCRYLDLHPVEGAAERTVVGDLNDEAVVAEAVKDQQALIYLAMGTIDGDRYTVGEIDPAFNVNVRGFYRVLSMALKAGVQRACFASSMSIYARLSRRAIPVDEREAPDAWHPYGMTKRLAEAVCRGAAQRYPDATLLALRLMHPCSEEQWSPSRCHAARGPHQIGTGPNDLRQLFLRALECDRPGCHVVQATGDFTNRYLPNRRVHELLGWLPQNH